MSLQQLFFLNILNKLLQCEAIHGQDSAYIQYDKWKGYDGKNM